MLKQISSGEKSVDDFIFPALIIKSKYETKDLVNLISNEVTQGNISLDSFIRAGYRDGYTVDTVRTVVGLTEQDIERLSGMSYDEFRNKYEVKEKNGIKNEVSKEMNNDNIDEISEKANQDKKDIGQPPVPPKEDINLEVPGDDSKTDLQDEKKEDNYVLFDYFADEANRDKTEVGGIPKEENIDHTEVDSQNEENESKEIKEETPKDDNNSDKEAIINSVISEYTAGNIDEEEVKQAIKENGISKNDLSEEQKQKVIGALFEQMKQGKISMGDMAKITDAMNEEDRSIE